MWTPIIEKMKSKSDRERIEIAEKEIKELKETVAKLKAELEKVNGN